MPESRLPAITLKPGVAENISANLRECKLMTRVEAKLEHIPYDQYRRPMSVTDEKLHFASGRTFAYPRACRLEITPKELPLSLELLQHVLI